MTLENIKVFLSNVIVQYAFKIGGVVLTYVGVTQASALEWVSGAVAFVIGVIGHWLQVQATKNTIGSVKSNGGQ